MRQKISTERARLFEELPETKSVMSPQRDGIDNEGFRIPY
jgi:hypothetical protein